MKNLFKIKRPHRSNEIPQPSPSPSPSQSTAAAATSCSSSSSSSSPAPVALSPSTAPSAASPAAAAAGPGGAGEKEDYFSSEEEFQIQLAMALSASNSDFGGDPDSDQIRKAKLLSLGRDRIGRDREEGTAEWVSRRYWDYNVLDYHEKVIDGFYDIFGLSVESSRQGKMPSLADLHTSIGDLGFEVIVINRAIDTSLLEMEQIAQCILLDYPVAQIAPLVQRIAELVTDNMGGPVKDANDMLARWMENSIELRTTLQTSLLPIGCIKIGLSRHRALLFKILADRVGVPCKLVKGSHYTGVDDDAVNIIKIDNEREFLVDLMAAPGTLIPADVLSSKGTPNSNPRLRQNQTAWATSSTDNDPSSETLRLEHKDDRWSLSGNGNMTSDNQSGCEKAITIPSSQNSWVDVSSITSGSSANEAWSLVPQEQSSQLSSSTATSSKQKDVLQNGGDLRASPDVQETELRNLFAELNPFQVIEAGRTSSPFKVSDNRNNELRRRRENVAPGPGRSQQPLVMKNWSACNEVSNTKQHNFVEGLFPRRNIGDNVASSSQVACSALKNSNLNVGGGNGTSYAAPVRNSDSKMIGTSAMNTACTSRIGNGLEKDWHGNLDRGRVDSRLEGQRAAVHPPGEKQLWGNYAQGMVLQNAMQHQAKERKENFDGKYDRKKLPHDPKKLSHDRFMDRMMEPKNPESISPSQNRSNRLDPMLDDVSECEILWEDLVIGERIGLGSYGEVYRADWNGTEVAVKKFLDQDFYGDALDEFRSEVRIMRRLRHPNIVLFMGAVTRPPNLSIVSEFLPRGSLYKILHRPNCPIDEKRRIKMALDVAKGMNCLHTSMPTIVHRDLKSPNLLVDNNWTVKVCDFGLSRLKHNTFLSSKSTAGTPEWMAPEVLRNEPSNEKCDVYSFGVILWELATLRMPWSGMNPMQVVGAVGFQDRRLDIPKEVDPLVARIIWECWQTDPSLRPSFAQLTSALKTLQRLVIPSHQETQSPPVPQEISVNSTP